MIVLKKKFRELYFRSRWVTESGFTLLPVQIFKNIPNIGEAAVSWDLNSKWWRTVVPKRQEPNDVNPMIVLAYCLDSFQAFMKGDGARSPGWQVSWNSQGRVSERKERDKDKDTEI